MADDWVMINFDVLDIEEQTQATHAVRIEAASLPKLVQGLRSPLPETQVSATSAIRNLLVRDDPPIQEVINAGAVPFLVQFLGAEDAKLQFEACWALSNIASGTSEQTSWLVEQGVVPLFVRLLESDSVNVQDQAVSALANIAGDSTDMRDVVLSHQALPAILQQLSCRDKLSFVRSSTWALQNLLRKSSLDVAHSAMPTLARLVQHKDKEVAADAAWAVSHVCKEGAGSVQLVVEHGILPQLLALLDRRAVAVQEGAASALATVAQSTEHIQALLEGGAMGKLIEMSKKYDDVDFEVRKEAVFCISRAVQGGTREQVQGVLDLDGFDAICRSTLMPDDYQMKDKAEGERMVVAAIEALGALLRHGEQERAESGCNPMLAAMHQWGSPSTAETMVCYTLEFDSFREAAAPLVPALVAREHWEEAWFDKSLLRWGAVQLVDEMPRGGPTEAWVRHFCPTIGELRARAAAALREGAPS